MRITALMFVAISLSTSAELSGQAPPLNTRASGALEATPEEITRDDQVVSNRSFGERCREQFSKNDTLRSFGCYGRNVLDLELKADAESYFGPRAIGNAISLHAGGGKASLYTELVSDNIWIAGWTGGYARLGLGTLVSMTDTAATTTAEQFFQSGGNATLYTAVPLFAWLNLTGDPRAPQETRRFDSFVMVSGSADVPALSGTADENAFSASVGLQGVFTWSSVADEFRFFVQAGTNYVNGTNAFYRNLAGDADGSPPNAGFLAAKATFGVDIAKLFRVGATWGESTLSGVSHPLRLNVQMLPKN